MSPYILIILAGIALSVSTLRTVVAQSIGIIWAFVAAYIFWLTLPIISPSFAGIGVFVAFALIPYTAFALAGDEDYRQPWAPRPPWKEKSRTSTTPPPGRCCTTTTTTVEI